MSRLTENPASSWSRRRAAVRAEAEADQKAVKAEVQAKAQAELARNSDEDILKELSLQDPEQMQSGDDFAAFMRAEVPERLRKRALRTLWRSNPVLACVDDLVDYGDDFKAEWNATGVIKTAYQVGKGMLAHVEEMERQKLAEQEMGQETDLADSPTPPELQVDDSANSLSEVMDSDISPTVSQENASETDDTTSQPDENAPQYKTTRRMRFDFDEVS